MTTKWSNFSIPVRRGVTAGATRGKIHHDRKWQPRNDCPDERSDFGRVELLESGLQILKNTEGYIPLINIVDYA